MFLFLLKHFIYNNTHFNSSNNYVIPHLFQYNNDTPVPTSNSVLHENLYERSPFDSMEKNTQKIESCQIVEIENLPENVEEESSIVEINSSDAIADLC